MTDRLDTADRTLTEGDAVDPGYEAPAITRLGHVASLTLLGSGGLDELENDGSIA